MVGLIAVCCKFACQQYTSIYCVHGRDRVSNTDYTQLRNMEPQGFFQAFSPRWGANTVIVGLRGGKHNGSNFQGFCRTGNSIAHS